MKKVISLIIVIVILTAIVTVSLQALSVSDNGIISVNEMLEANGLEPGDKENTQRIYFQMPNGNRGPEAESDIYYNDSTEDVAIHAGEKAPSWYNDYNVYEQLHYAGVYWWGGTGACDDWIGYRAEIEDYEQGIYYADIPLDVVMLIWNNGVDGDSDSSKPAYHEVAHTVDFNIEGCDESVYTTLPYGSPVFDESYDGCIFIVDPNAVSINAYSDQTTAGVNAYVYYGNGCYGSEMNNSTEYGETDGWSEDMQDVCLNPDHFVDGIHVGYHGDELSESTKSGDVNGNYSVTIADVTYLQKYLAYQKSLIGGDYEPVEPGSNLFIRSDVDQDDRISVYDALRIKRYLAKMCKLDGSPYYD